MLAAGGPQVAHAVAARPGDARAVRPVAIYVSNGGAAKPIPTGHSPHGFAFSRNGKLVYVVDAASGTVAAISTADNKIAKLITVGSVSTEPFAIAPDLIVISQDGKTACVMNFLTSGTVTPIRLATNMHGKPIKVGKDPDGLVLVP